MRRYPRIPGLEPVDEVESGADYQPIFDSTPRVIGSYQLGRRLGVGVLGPTFEAWHLSRQHAAVIKLLTIDDNSRDRLEAERVLLRRLEVLATLSHPHIVPLRDAGPTDDGIFIAVEPAPGRTLNVALAAGWHPTLDDAVALVTSLASALAYAHGIGLVHGSLHGDNIVLDEQGQPHITDLGLVQAARGRAQVDDHAGERAHRAFRTPEHPTPGDGDPAGDTYAVGVLLIRLLFDESTFQQWAADQQRLDLDRARWDHLELLRPDLPAPLGTWIRKATDPDPLQRPDLADGLPRDTTAKPAGPRALVEVPRVQSRHLRTVGLALVSLVAIGLIAIAGTAPTRFDRLWRADPARQATLEALDTPPPAIAEPAPLAADTGMHPKLRLDR